MKRLAVTLFFLFVLSAVHAQSKKPNLKLTPTTATVTWTQSASSGITSNNVYQGSSSTGPFTKIYSSAAPITTYTVTGLAPLTTYYFTITAVCSACSPAESTQSAPGSGTTSGNPQPAAPTNVQVTSNGGGTVNPVETLAENDASCSEQDMTGPTEVYRTTASAKVTTP